MKAVFIVPCFNASRNLSKLIGSIKSQNNENWELVLIDDISEDDTAEQLEKYKSDKISVIINTEKKYALRNIVETARKYEDEDCVICVVDGDDQLSNNEAVDIILDEYSSGYDVVWTAHRWDINGMNISKSMPHHVDPYQWPWCSSHLRTFKSSILKEIPDINFKDTNGNWFIRGYDQALMLPVLHIGSNRKYIDKVCYQYNIESVSVNDRDWAENIQHSTVNLVRSRGFIKK